MIRRLSEMSLREVKRDAEARFPQSDSEGQIDLDTGDLQVLKVFADNRAISLPRHILIKEVRRKYVDCGFSSPGSYRETTDAIVKAEETGLITRGISLFGRFYNLVELEPLPSST